MTATSSRPGWLERGHRLLHRVGNEGYYVGCCYRSGMIGIDPPVTLARLGRAYYRYGMLGGVIAAAAARFPDRSAVIDEQGELSYRELNRQVDAIANAWRAAGLKPGDGVAILTRNHRGFLQAMFAGAKCGARVILMNTGFSAPQVREVSEREGTDLLVYDEEFAPLLGDLTLPQGRFRAWADTRTDEPDTLAALIASASATPAPPKPSRAPRLVIMTSGTTGTPKGAGRDVPVSLSPVGGPLSKVPFHSGDVTQISAPLFHALGFTQGLLQIGLGATLVLQRRFDGAEVLKSLEQHRVNTWIVVPVMLQRSLQLATEWIAGRDLSALRIIYMSGSQLGVDLEHRSSEAFGNVLYNLYGSTEIAYATIATPEDLAVEPGCVGRVVRGARVRILDADGEELPIGETGRIFVGHMLEFEGYTGGGDKERIRGMVSSGDLGHFDADGRLFIDGRDDEMIISGGENVFPGEVEELLHLHPDILEAAAIGMPDPDFGQTLTAFVVLREGAELSAEEIREYVRANLARYKAPREVVFLSTLPRNPTGKVLKRELLER
jgi:fatty-acyl-CoA synthase